MLVDYSFIRSDVRPFQWMCMGSGKRVLRPRPLQIRTARDSMFDAILRNRILVLWLR